LSQQEFFESKKTTTNDRFIGIAETATYLGVSQRSVRNMLYDRRLKGYKLGDRTVRLRLSEIDAALTPYGAA
jgi:excisionase family DNA binding protein